MSHLTPPPQSEHPKVLINIILINSNETEILFVKRRNQAYWELLGNLFKYSDTLEQNIREMISETTFKLNPDVNIFDKVKFIGTLNAVDKEKDKHFVELIYDILDGIFYSDRTIGHRIKLINIHIFQLLYQKLNLLI